MREQFDVIVIGAGQAGLAIGWHLKQQGASFMIVDGAPEVGHSWRSRWDSLRLFTPALRRAARHAVPRRPGPLPDQGRGGRLPA